MKKCVVAVLGLIMAMSLFACGVNPSDSGQQSGSQQANQSQNSGNGQNASSGSGSSQSFVSDVVRALQTTNMDDYFDIFGQDCKKTTYLGSHPRYIYKNINVDGMDVKEAEVILKDDKVWTVCISFSVPSMDDVQAYKDAISAVFGEAKPYKDHEDEYYWTANSLGNIVRLGYTYFSPDAEYSTVTEPYYFVTITSEEDK